MDKIVPMEKKFLSSIMYNTMIQLGTPEKMICDNVQNRMEVIFFLHEMVTMLEGGLKDIGEIIETITMLDELCVKVACRKQDIMNVDDYISFVLHLRAESFMKLKLRLIEMKNIISYALLDDVMSECMDFFISMCSYYIVNTKQPVSTTTTCFIGFGFSLGRGRRRRKQNKINNYNVKKQNELFTKYIKDTINEIKRSIMDIRNYS